MKELEDFLIAERDKLHSMLSYSMGSPHDADDVIQEACLRALLYQKSWNEGITPFEHWFRRILQRCRIDFLNDLTMRGVNEPLEESLADEEDPSNIDDVVLGNTFYEEICQIERCEHRQVLFLYFCREYTLKEIQMLTGTSRSNTRKIVERFRDHVERKYPTDQPE